jgi:L-cysteine:1D-myo-inositol 2-amino-2-deoxy-alpha-D-glucopyranoside ligase
MKSWATPQVPAVDVDVDVDVDTGVGGLVVRVFDTASGALVAVGPENPSTIASLYVCGITPYDATHLGHAATYLAYDTLVRSWLFAGHEVRYVQNVTDVDDPLLERATATGVDWRELAESQTNLFRSDMESLRVIPPQNFIAVTDVVPEIAETVSTLIKRGIGYGIEGDPFGDIYFDSAEAEQLSNAWHLGGVSGLDRATMLSLSAQRGGDPDRVGKRDPLDPLLWRGAREGEPSWPAPADSPAPMGTGRPGWHIECAEIARLYAGVPLSVQGGGSDLIFPHHEFTAGHVAALDGVRLAGACVHTGMVAYEGEKMSKSLGNLVLVSTLTAGGTDPRAIRLALLAQHYRSDWEWTPELLTAAEERLQRLVVWAAITSESAAESADASPTAVVQLAALLAHDLQSPQALSWLDAQVSGGLVADASLLEAIDALLGIKL